MRACVCVCLNACACACHLTSSSAHSLRLTVCEGRQNCWHTPLLKCTVSDCREPSCGRYLQQTHTHKGDKYLISFFSTFNNCLKQIKACFRQLGKIPDGHQLALTLTRLHSHWHPVVELLHCLVVDGDGHLRVGVEGELHIVAGTALCRVIVARQLQVFAAP